MFKRKGKRGVVPWTEEEKAELRAFVANVGMLSPLPGTNYEASLKAEIRTLSLILESKVLFEVESDFAPPLLAVVTGGTNVGKSEVFNALIETDVGLPDPRAGMTRHPAIYVHEAHRKKCSGPGFLPGATKEVLFERSRLNAEEDRQRLRAYLKPHDREALKDLALVDSPDIDSNRKGNQAWALRLAAVADAVVFVTSPSKYNDEACVAFLRRVVEAGKRVVVAFNFLEDAASRVVEDFAANVWGPLGASDPEIVRLPLAAGQASEALREPLAAVRGSLVEDAANGPAVKARIAAASFARFESEARRVLDTLEGEDQAVEEVRESLHASADQAASVYRRRVEDTEFLEIEEVFHGVLRIFRVPVLDDVLGAPRAAFSWARKRFFGTERGRTLEERITARREGDLQWIREQAEALRLDLLSSLSARGAGGVAEVIRDRLKSRGFDAVPHADIERLVRDGDAKIEAWVKATRDEIVDAIQNRPFLRKFLKSARVLLQVGSGVLVAALTGGFGSADLLLGPAAATFAQYFLETFGASYFNDKRRRFNEMQLEKFNNVARETLRVPFDKALPGRPEGHDLKAVKAGMEKIARKFG